MLYNVFVARIFRACRRSRVLANSRDRAAILLSSGRASLPASLLQKQQPERAGDGRQRFRPLCLVALRPEVTLLGTERPSLSACIGDGPSQLEELAGADRGAIQIMAG
jgi:hypothetical protein